MSARILLVDVAAPADGFVGASGLVDLAAPLAAAGAEVTTVRLVGAVVGALDGALDGALGGTRGAALGGTRGDALTDSVARELPPEPFELVIVGRVPSGALIAALRARCPGAKLVRFSSSRTEAALDARFDHVVDAAGAVALARGAAAEPLAWRPTATRDLKARLARAAAAPIAPGRPGSPLPLAMAGSRPTLSGPAGGCPYLRDARSEPVFAALSLDPTRVQTKGCTFCLDNDGSYAVASAEATLGAWLAGLRAVRAADPGAREVLLTDERPHPFLPALFRALAAEPALGGLELLVKSRVDWLLEFEPEIAEAAALAAASGSVLDVYLVGFESFAEEDLRLFNKGHDVAASRRAIALLADLAARFPASFEHRRLRAHGIVLFTPWTTPATLLENARVMREVAFHELRAEALRTRLRLYPRTPLYHLAEHEGLLESAYGGARGDRAAEQGYDASTAWRFRDARVEAIWCAANALDRSLVDADALELAVTFVLRWPALAAEPAAAPVLLAHALAGWEGRASEVVAALGPAAGINRELEAVRAGDKPAALCEGVAGHDADALVLALRAAGLAAAIAGEHALAARGVGAHASGESHRLVAAANDEATLAAVLAAQRAVERGDAGAIASMAALMGYPPCCAAAFAALPDRRDNAENERAPFRRAPAPLDPLLNRVGLVQLVSHHLCAPDCAPSVAIAAAALARVAAVSDRAAAWVLQRLRAPVLFLDYARRYELAGEARDGVFHASAITPIAGAPPIAAAAGRLRRARGGLVVCDEGDRPVATFATEDPLLVVPGARPVWPLAPEPRAAPDAPPAPRLPPLPAAFQRGVRVLGYAIADVRRGHDAHAIVLARGAERITVHAWARPPAGALAVGAFAVTVEGAAPDASPGRAAVALVLRALERAPA